MSEDATAIVEVMKVLAAEEGVFVHYTVEEAGRAVEKEAERLRNPSDFCCVAEVGGSVIGVFSLDRDPWTLTGHVAYLGMGIAREFRHQGIGTAMVRHGLEWAKRSQGITRVELEVFTENEVAIRLYNKFGFEIEGRKRCSAYKWDRYLDSYIMALLLPNRIEKIQHTGSTCADTD